MALAPASRHASWIYQEKFQRETQRLQPELDRIKREHGADSQEYQDQLRLVRDAAYRFLDKPLYDDSFRGQAYLDLFYALSAMNPIPAEELADAVRGLVRYERLNPHITYSTAPISMADHTPYAEEAAELARGGIQAMIDKAEERRWEEDSLNYYLSLVHDAIGWASYKAGRVEEGRNELEQALELSESNTSVSLPPRPSVRAHGDRG